MRNQSRWVMQKKKVFVSSVMNGELDQERAASIEMIDANRYLYAWDFGREPASADELSRSYLKHVDDCSVFVIIVAADVTPAVEDEFNQALRARRRILVFRKIVPVISNRAKSILDRAKVKYASFASVSSLREELSAALDEHIGDLLSGRAEPIGDRTTEQLAEFAARGAEIKVSPVVPQGCELDILTVKQYSADIVSLYKNTGETIYHPTLTDSARA